MTYRDLSANALETLVTLVKSKMEDLAVAVEFGELLEADKRELQAALADYDAKLVAANERIAELEAGADRADRCIESMRNTDVLQRQRINALSIACLQRYERIAELETKLTAIWELVAPELIAPEPDQSAESPARDDAAIEGAEPEAASEPVAPLALCDIGSDTLHIFPSDHVPDGAIVLRNLHEPIDGLPVWDWVAGEPIDGLPVWDWGTGELVREVDGELETFSRPWQAMTAWKP